MSVKAMTWALYEVPDLKPTTRLVLCVLADHAGHDGTGAFPSRKTIGQAVGIDPRNVLTHLQTLESLGVIKKGDQRHVQHYQRQYRPMVYDLCLDAADRLSAVMSASPLEGIPASPPARTPASPPGVMKNAPRGDARGDASITQTFKPKDKPEPARGECPDCDRTFDVEDLSQSGRCRDCLPPPAPTPGPDQGTGYAQFKAQRERLRTDREAAEKRAADEKAALTERMNHHAQTTHPPRTHQAS